MNYDNLIEAISSLKVVNIERTQVNVGRDDSYYNYCVFYNFNTPFFKKCFELALRKHRSNIEIKDYYIEVLMEHDRCTVEKTGKWYQFHLKDDVKLKLWLFDIIMPIFRDKKKPSVEPNKTRYTDIFQCLIREFDTILTLKSSHNIYYCLDCHYVNNLSSKEIASRTFEIGKQHFLDLSLLFNGQRSDKMSQEDNKAILYMDYYFKTLLIQEELDKFQQPLNNFEYFEKRLQSYYLKSYKFPQGIEKFVFGERVYLLDNNNAITEGLIRGYNQITNRYIITYKFMVDQPWTEEIEGDRLISSYKYDNKNCDDIDNPFEN